MRLPGLALLLVALAQPAGAEEFALGARIRGVWLPAGLISAVAETHSSLSSIAGGVELIVRKPRYDVVTSLDLMFLNLTDANFLQGGRDPFDGGCSKSIFRCISITDG